jgi:hypothetical protein
MDARLAAATEARRLERHRSLVPALVGAALALAVVVPLAAGSRVRADPAGPVTVAGLARPTFHSTVEPILQARCQGCHHDGGIGPIPLVRYRDAEEHAAQVARMVDSRRMPPWKAAAGPHAFANDPTLTWAEREAIVRWARRGAPEGKASEAPPPRSSRRAGSSASRTWFSRRRASRLTSRRATSTSASSCRRTSTAASGCRRCRYARGTPR